MAVERLLTGDRSMLVNVVVQIKSVLFLLTNGLNSLETIGREENTRELFFAFTKTYFFAKIVGRYNKQTKKNISRNFSSFVIIRF